jgi:hypothetical protein
MLLACSCYTGSQSHIVPNALGYGGYFENRIRLSLEIVDAVQASNSMLGCVARQWIAVELGMVQHQDINERYAGRDAPDEHLGEWRIPLQS